MSARYALETKAARAKLPPRRKPYEFESLERGISIGYRKNINGPGTWVVKVTNQGPAWTKAIGSADDLLEADGVNALDFRQAKTKALELGRGAQPDIITGRPATVAEAIDAYEANLVARGGNPENARRLRRLFPSLLARPVAMLTTAELMRCRDNLANADLAGQRRAPSGINRDIKPLKAALNLAAKTDPRITNAKVWEDGLEALPDAHRARNVILSDVEVRAIVAAAYFDSHDFGLFVETAAQTGARESQLHRLEVADLQADRPDPRLMMPSSRKGQGNKIDRKPVAIPAALAAALRVSAAGRPAHEPLLVHGDSRYAWDRTVERAAKDLVTDPRTVTLYALRHSSIARQLAAGTPIRLVAAAHDTSVAMIEKSYSDRILDHSDGVLRRGHLDMGEPAASNVVALRGQR
jgi:integrase